MNPYFSRWLSHQQPDHHEIRSSVTTFPSADDCRWALPPFRGYRLVAVTEAERKMMNANLFENNIPSGYFT